MTSATPSAEHHSTLETIRQQRTDQLAQWQELTGLTPYPYRFEKTHTNQQLQEAFASLADGTETDTVVRVAGRVMAIRNTGLFMDCHDPTGKIQLFSHKESLNEACLPLLKLFDLGDIVGAEGTVRRTPRGELSIRVRRIELLTKSLLPLPEKYHGLTDVETRYRQRYLDLIMNPETRDTLVKRSKIITAVREYLTQHGFLEVETPILQHQAGGAAAKPFHTHHNSLAMDMVLRIAPELYLKRLVVGGLSEKVFELNRNFRNEGISPRHNPEFTMMEVYQAYADYTDMMVLTENLFAHVAQTVLGTTQVAYGDTVLDFTPPWPRRTMAEMVYEVTGVDFMALNSDDEARAQGTALGVHVRDFDGWGHVLEQVFEEKVEHTLIQPIHITDYPVEVSPLAKCHRHNPRLTERFETRINGWEVANAFSELNDPQDQRQRFEAQLAERDAGNDEAHHLDEDFITALEYGLPPTGGLGVGIDRLVMLLTNSHNIRDVIAFPTLKPRA
ncbi:MAG: lysine--tRNA ligase [Vampirovibrionales bacterium]